MANTACRIYTVECYPGYWVIKAGGQFITTTSVRELVDILRGVGAARKSEAKPAPAIRAETPEEFYARTGQTPESIRAKTEAEYRRRIAAEQPISLEFLGLGTVKEMPKVGVPVFPSSKRRS